MLRWPFLLVVVLAPLPLGSNRPIPWTLLALAVGILLLAWSGAAVLRPGRGVVPPDRFWPAVVGLVLVAGIALLQMTALSPRAWQHPLWVQAGAVLGPQVGGRISVNPHETGTSLMRLLSYAGVFWLALQLGREPHGARRIVQAIAIAGLGYAVYGLLVFLLDLQLVLWWRKWTWMTGVTSSFVNRNSYATYAGLGLICTVGLLITTVYRDWRSRRFRRLPWRVRLLRITWRGWWLVGGTVCLAFALLLTGSRAGVASSASGLAVLVASFGLTRLMRQRDVLITGGLALTVGVAALVLGGDDLVHRLAQKDVQDDPRFATYQRIAHAVTEAPWLGTGYGTFPEVFRSYQSGASNAFWNHAHNTYLENALELGVPTAATLVAAIGWLACLCARSLQRRRASALYPCLGIAATVLVGLHALLDFSLELPGVAVTYAAIMGAACSRAGRSVGPDRHQQSGAWRGPQGRALGLAVATAVGILALALPRLTAELTALPAQLVVRQLDAGMMPPAGRLDRAIESGRRAAAWADAGQNWSRVARAELALAEQPDMLPRSRRSRLERADQAFRQALAHAPADPAAWARLAYVTLLLRGDAADINGALTLSVLTGPSFGGVMPLRSGIAALAWKQLDPPTRALFEPQFVKTMQFAPQPFVEAIRRSDGVGVVRAQLEGEPELEREFERLLLILGRR